MKFGNLLAIAVISLMMCASLSHAEMTINVSEVGGDVVASANGTVNTAGISPFGGGTINGGFTYGSGYNAFYDGVLMVSAPAANIDGYIINSPVVFSTGTSIFNATSNSGGTIGITLSSTSGQDRLKVPPNYVSNSPISATSTWAGTTITSLGLIPGTYVITWGSGDNADSLTLTIDASAAPSTYSVSGDVGGPAGATMRLRQAGDHTVFATVVTNGTGNYTFPGLSDGDYTIQPSIFGYEYTPGVAAVTISGADVTGIDFLAQLNQPGNRIYGTVTGPGAVGATLTLGTDPQTTTTTDSAGYYIFLDVPNGTYTLVPSLTGFTFTSDDPSIPATVNDYDRHMPNFTSAAGTSSPQTITGFTATPSSRVVGGSSTLSATASSGLTVTFGSDTPTVCTVAGSTVSYLLEGTCTVTADQAGDASFDPAPQVTLDIGVGLTDQVITNFVATPSTGVVNGSSTLSATGGASGNPVVFGSNTLAVCTVAGSTVTYVTAGTCTVTADQAGDASFNAAPTVTLDITVDKADQTITGLTANPATGVAGGTSALSATASSGLAVTFGSSTPAVCTVAGSTVTYVTAGTCTVTADQAGDADYNAALQVTIDITVAKADQTITGLAADPATGVVGGSSALSATASSGLTVSFGSSTPAVCTVTGATVSYLAAGTCTVIADQAGDAAYSAATQVTLDINTTELPPAIPNVPIPTLSLWGLVAMFLVMLGIGGMVVRRKTRS